MDILLNLNPVNVLLAALVGAGLFVLVFSLGYRPDVNLHEIEKVYVDGREQLSPFQRLQRQLDAARLNVRAGEFLGISLGLALLGGLGVYLLTGVEVTAAFGAVAGALVYTLYLSRRASKNLEAYEDELPQVVARLISGAQMGNPLAAAAEHVAKFGPELCREDWVYISEQLQMKRTPGSVFKAVAEKRRSALLNLILEMLLLQQETAVPLTSVLPLIQESLTERVRTMRKARTKMQEPLRDLQIVAAVPFIVVPLFRLISPEFSRGFASSIGQIIILVGWSITLVVFIYAYRAFSNELRKETSFNVPLGMDSRRPKLPASGPKPGGPVSLGPGYAPSALSGITRRDEPGGR